MNINVFQLNLSRDSNGTKTPTEDDLVVIREIYDSENAQEIFEIELETAIQVRIPFWIESKYLSLTDVARSSRRTMIILVFYVYSRNSLIKSSSIFQSGCKTIIIEPTELGENTEKWISYGNYLYRSAVFTGISAYFVGVYWQDQRFLPLPFGFTSCLCSTLYTLCWSYDPCSQYKVSIKDFPSSDVL